MRRALVLTLGFALGACQWVIGIEKRQPVVIDASDATQDIVSPCIDTQSDPRNCGACGRACEGACTAGICAPRVIATIAADSEVTCVGVRDDDVVYGVAQDYLETAKEPTSQLRTVRTDGTSDRVIAQDTQCMDVVVDGSDIFVLTPDRIGKLELPKGSIAIVASEQYKAFRALSVSKRLRWTTFTEVRESDRDGGNLAIGAALDGAPFTRRPAASITQTETSVEWAIHNAGGCDVLSSPFGSVPDEKNATAHARPKGDGCYGVAIWKGDVLWMTSSELRRYSSDGGNESIFGTNARGRSVRVDGAHAYVVEGARGSNGTIWRVDPRGIDAPRVVAKNVGVPAIRPDPGNGNFEIPWDNYPWTIAGRYVYFLAGSEGARTIVRVPL